ncbi:hypothetical protein AC629_13330 [Bradyrhizobium sp. NAS80.1]|nr:hypothetical protein AC629_13330 [Bradyrhizobium sp. NAS80.1]
MYGERFGYSRQNKQAWIALPTLNASDIREVYLGFEGKFLLGHSSFLANPPHIFADDFAPILHCRIEHGGAYSL